MKKVAVRKYHRFLILSEQILVQLFLKLFQPLIAILSIMILLSITGLCDELMSSQYQFLKEKSASMQESLMHEQYVSAGNNFVTGTVVWAARSFIAAEDKTPNRNIFAAIGTAFYGWSAWKVYTAASTNWQGEWQTKAKAFETLSQVSDGEKKANEVTQKVLALRELEDLWRKPAHTNLLLRTFFGCLLGTYSAYLIYFGISEKYVWYQTTLDSSLFAGLAAYNLLVPSPLEEQWQEYLEIYDQQPSSALRLLPKNIHLALHWIPSHPEIKESLKLSPALSFTVGLD